MSDVELVRTSSFLAARAANLMNHVIDRGACMQSGYNTLSKQKQATLELASAAILRRKKKISAASFRKKPAGNRRWF